MNVWHWAVPSRPWQWKKPFPGWKKTDARAAQVAELFVFAGLEQARIGETLGISRITVARDWRFAKAFLKHELS